MLWKMTQKQLSRLITPLSSVLKDSVRESALALGLSASGSKESQDICFIPRGESYIDFIESRIGSLPEGEYIDKDQRVIGRHKGILRYTVGQRKGLGESFGKHMFIKRGKGQSVDWNENNHEYAKRFFLGAFYSFICCKTVET